MVRHFIYRKLPTELAQFDYLPVPNAPEVGDYCIPPHAGHVEDQTASRMDNRLSVVYADDDDLVRDVLTQVLVHEGIDVHACGSGAEALMLCQQLLPDTVLLDLNMPDMDGLETARALRGDPHTRCLRLVAITGRGTWELRNKALQAGFGEFIVKPVFGSALVRALQPPD